MGDAAAKLAAKPAAKVARSATGKVARGPERHGYTLQDFRRMVVATLQGKYPSPKATAESAQFNFPTARASLERYVSEIRKDPRLFCSTPSETRARQIEYAHHLEFKIKGNEDFALKRLFSEDNLAFFARSLKMYADLGWPMDVLATQHMFSRAAKGMGVTNTPWKPGDEHVVSRSYVTKFLNHPKWELKTLKASNIDPLRSKKATSQVQGRIPNGHVIMSVSLDHILTCLISYKILGEMLPIF